MSRSRSACGRTSAGGRWSTARGRSWCGSRAASCRPYKGAASYWSLDAGGRRREDIAWSYEQPLPDAVAIAGLVAFWDERVDVFLDGERREKASGAIPKALRDEFGV